jgi:A nuclease family of the HNH/ENDO VII superfamily with conserved AHH
MDQGSMYGLGNGSSSVGFRGSNDLGQPRLRAYGPEFGDVSPAPIDLPEGIIVMDNDVDIHNGRGERLIAHDLWNQRRNQADSALTAKYQEHYKRLEDAEADAVRQRAQQVALAKASRDAAAAQGVSAQNDRELNRLPVANARPVTSVASVEELGPYRSDVRLATRYGYSRSGPDTLSGVLVGAGTSAAHAVNSMVNIAGNTVLALGDMLTLGINRDSQIIQQAYAQNQAVVQGAVNLVSDLPGAIRRGVDYGMDRLAQAQALNAAGRGYEAGFVAGELGFDVASVAAGGYGAVRGVARVGAAGVELALGNAFTGPASGSLRSQIGAAGSIDFAALLREKIGDPPAGMIDPHAHHILFKEGNGVAQKALVQEGQAILREYGIDPIKGTENLVWAPNRVAGQHHIDSLSIVVNELKQVKEFGGTRNDIIMKLQELGQLAARRR